MAAFPVLMSTEPNQILTWIESLTGILGFGAVAARYEWKFVEKLSLTEVYKTPMYGVEVWGRSRWSQFRDEEHNRFLEDCDDHSERLETIEAIKKWSSEYLAAPATYPIIVVRSAGESQEILVKDGNHRIAEASYLGWEHIPAVVGMPIELWCNYSVS